MRTYLRAQPSSHQRWAITLMEYHLQFRLSSLCHLHLESLLQVALFLLYYVHLEIFKTLRRLYHHQDQHFPHLPCPLTYTFIPSYNQLILLLLFFIILLSIFPW